MKQKTYNYNFIDISLTSALFKSISDIMLTTSLVFTASLQRAAECKQTISELVSNGIRLATVTNIWTNITTIFRRECNTILTATKNCRAQNKRSGGYQQKTRRLQVYRSRISLKHNSNYQQKWHNVVYHNI